MFAGRCNLMTIGQFVNEYSDSVHAHELTKSKLESFAPKCANVIQSGRELVITIANDRS